VSGWAGLPGSAGTCGKGEPDEDLPTGKWMQHQGVSLLLDGRAIAMTF
jgi:hypothetical protein